MVYLRLALTTVLRVATRPSTKFKKFTMTMWTMKNLFSVKFKIYGCILVIIKNPRWYFVLETFKDAKSLSKLIMI